MTEKEKIAPPEVNVQDSLDKNSENNSEKLIPVTVPRLSIAVVIDMAKNK